ncbi:Uncharacterized protein HZ326_14955 [Fusarium oxysporum f. sp. albedinis]|nr:Uncharacterized protein HZ326_14955 [Fusarium oxysporum f. sp. albedinis]
MYCSLGYHQKSRYILPRRDDNKANQDFSDRLLCLAINCPESATLLALFRGAGTMIRHIARGRYCWNNGVLSARDGKVGVDPMIVHTGVPRPPTLAGYSRE